MSGTFLATFRAGEDGVLDSANVSTHAAHVSESGCFIFETSFLTACDRCVGLVLPLHTLRSAQAARRLPQHVCET